MGGISMASAPRCVSAVIATLLVVCVLFVLKTDSGAFFSARIQWAKGAPTATDLSVTTDLSTTTTDIKRVDKLGTAVFDTGKRQYAVSVCDKNGQVNTDNTKAWTVDTGPLAHKLKSGASCPAATNVKLPRGVCVSTFKLYGSWAEFKVPSLSGIKECGHGCSINMIDGDATQCGGEHGYTVRVPGFCAYQFTVQPGYSCSAGAVEQPPKPPKLGAAVFDTGKKQAAVNVCAGPGQVNTYNTLAYSLKQGPLANKLGNCATDGTVKLPRGVCVSTFKLYGFWGGYYNSPEGWPMPGVMPGVKGGGGCAYGCSINMIGGDATQCGGEHGKTVHTDWFCAYQVTVQPGYSC